MRFIIEPINETDCRIINVDCSALQGKTLNEVTVPSTIEQDGKTWQVKEVGLFALLTNKRDEDASKYAALRRLKKIVFSEGIEIIRGVMNSNGSNAEERGNRDSLSEVLFPSTLREIGPESFCACTALKSIYLHDGLEVIGDYSFNGCSSLSSIHIPDSVKKIGVGAFSYCKSLPPFPWPKSLETLGENAFAYTCFPKYEDGKPVFKVDLPDSLKTIRGCPYGWTSLQDGGLALVCRFSAAEWNVLDSSSMTNNIVSIDIPEGVTKISGKFYNLNHVTLPSTLEEVGDKAFYGILSHNSHVLNCIDELPPSLRIIGRDAFNGAYVYDKDTWDIKEFRIPSSLESVGANAFHNDGHIKLVGEHSVMSRLMGMPGVFNGTAVDTIDIPDGATEVWVKDCPELTRLTIPSTAKRITSISNCPKLESLVIPDSVTEIGILDGLPALKELKLSAKLEKLCQVGDCGEVKEITLPDTMSNIGKGAIPFSGFKGDIIASPKVWKLLSSEKYGLQDYQPSSGVINIPEGVEELADELCKNCTAKTINLPDGLTKLGTAVFKDNLNLESITFPSSMRHYGDIVYWGNETTPFERCKNLKYAVFLSDDPATAVYPIKLGKLCDWYVPDSMVDHVMDFVEKVKKDYSGIKGIGAKSVKPLSKLKSAATAESKKKAPEKKTQAKKGQALTQPINVKTFVDVCFKFAVAEEDMHMLDNNLDASILAARYLHDKISECSFEFFNDANENYEELSFERADNHSEEYAHCTAKSIENLNLSDAGSFPEGFPVVLASELAEKGGFLQLFASRCRNFKKELPDGAPAYLKIKIPISIDFDFMIGEKEKFNIKRITVMEDWVSKPGSYECWRFGFFYKGRYITATSITGRHDDDYIVYVYASKDRDGNDTIEIPDTKIDDVEYECEFITLKEFPFSDMILSLSK